MNSSIAFFNSLNDNSIMKIIFFGTPDICLPTLESLAKNSDVDILAVFTQPDKPVGRKQTLTPPAVKILAQELKIKVYQPKTSAELAEQLGNFDADFFLVFAYGMILKKNILNMPKYGAINIHTSLLPKYRGASPIQQALLNGDETTGLSFIKMDEKMDHGDIYLIKRVPIAPTDDLTRLTQKLAMVSGEITYFTLKDIEEGALNPLSQNHAQATYCKKINKEDGEINWEKSAEEIKNMIRAYNPWPSTYMELLGKKCKIIEAEVEESKNLEPGKIQLHGKTLAIGTKKGVLLPQKIQIEGKNVMNIGDFINGNQKALAEASKPE